jgi:hypothetical protein
MKNLENHTLYSGMALGADYAFAFYAKKYGVGKQVHYRPKGNTTVNKDYKQLGITPVVLDDDQMDECYQFMFKCMEGKPKKKYKRTFALDLCARNYYQVKNANAVYAVAELTPDFKNVQGGTRYAVSYAKCLRKLIYVFDYTKEAWYVWVDDNEGFVLFHDIPILFENFAGIGSRKIQNYKLKDKNTGEWIDNPDYVGDTLKNIALKAVKDLFENMIDQKVK